jgi:hypothetical protein
MEISMYRSYLNWFKEKDLYAPNYQPKDLQPLVPLKAVEEEEPVPKKKNITMMVSGRTRSNNVA